MKPKRLWLRLIDGCFNWLRRRHNHLMSKYAPEIYERDMCKYIRNNGNNNLIGAEVGVDYGRNAECFLKTLSLKKLYLVDPFDKNYFILPEMEKRLKKYSDKIIFIRKPSYEAIDELPDGFDFIYLGANNNCYESVKRDISLLYHKVKSGGVFGGCSVGHKMASQRAILEFIDNNNLKLNHISGEYDWWIKKP